MRVDAGYIASPLGLGMLDMRADLNPTIQPHLSYFVPLLPFDSGAPAVGAITASYPLGAAATVSTTRWDARAAIVNSAPTRRSAFNSARGNPDSTPVFIAGGGVTPRPGLRLGAGFARGQYATDRELRDPASSRRDLRMWTVEGEYAFGYTKLAGEWTAERFLHGATQDTAFTWFGQVLQTLAPRWFVAARHEAISAPPLAVAATGAPRLSFRTSEGTVGYRLTPELTLRASVTASRWYTASTSDQKAGVQVVWSPSFITGYDAVGVRIAVAPGLVPPATYAAGARRATVPGAGAFQQGIPSGRSRASAGRGGRHRHRA